jgi:hypothetical protein
LGDEVDSTVAEEAAKLLPAREFSMSVPHEWVLKLAGVPT